MSVESGKNKMHIMDLLINLWDFFFIHLAYPDTICSMNSFTSYPILYVIHLKFFFLFIYLWFVHLFFILFIFYLHFEQKTVVLLN